MAAQDMTRTLAPVVLGTDEGEALWFNNDLLTVRATSDATGGGFTFVEELARAGKVTPLHDHPDAAESFRVLDGTLRFHLDGRELELGPGGFVSVPAGVPHAYCVTSATARSLILITPGSPAMEAFFHDAGEPAGERVLPPDGPLDIARIGAAAERTGAVRILGPPPFAAPAS